MNLKLSLILILTLSCSQTKPDRNYTDKQLRAKDSPAFLKASVPQTNVEDIEYFIKKSSVGISYEVKYEVNELEISHTFTEQGVFLEKEEDIKFSSLDESVKEKIQNHLKSRFSKFRLHETEMRTDKDRKTFIDVEVSHDEPPTGLSELSYDPQGNFITEEVENTPDIQTLN